MDSFTSQDLIAISYEDKDLILAAEELTELLEIPLVEITNKHFKFLLCLTVERLELRSREKLFKPFYVDFLAGELNYRQQYGGGCGQALTKAIGLKHGHRPSILDLTAGLGKDSFILASLGCPVFLIERSKIVAALLQDGIKRAQVAPRFSNYLKMSLQVADAREVMPNLIGTLQPEVIYIDPMYPCRNQTALAKKDMRLLRELVGDDQDADNLLALALNYPCRRIVVKRHRLAPYLNAIKPDFSLIGKSTRFDIYNRASA